MSTISTHILDTALGIPAAGITVALFRVHDGVAVGTGVSDVDGRVRDLASTPATPGMYRMRFDTAAYFAASSRETFYPEVNIVFSVADLAHYHVPLLLGPFGYTTYRGS